MINKFQLNLSKSNRNYFRNSKSYLFIILFFLKHGSFPTVMLCYVMFHFIFILLYEFRTVQVNIRTFGTILFIRQMLRAGFQSATIMPKVGDVDVIAQIMIEGKTLESQFYSPPKMIMITAITMTVGQQRVLIFWTRSVDNQCTCMPLLLNS